MPLATEFLTRMESVGIPVEAFHSEYGRGQYEYTCAPADPHHGRGLGQSGPRPTCASWPPSTAWSPPGCRACTPTPSTRRTAATSTCRWSGTDRNAFWDADRGGLSELASQAAAGILGTMSDFHLFFRPWVNSFRRMDRLSWSPEDASWGLDNHAAAIRVVHGSDPAKYTRFEHRAPGPDINPYLALAGIIYGAARGIREGWQPPAQTVGDPIEAGGYQMLPRTLEDSVTALRSSPVAKDLLGPRVHRALHDHEARRGAGLPGLAG